MTGFLFRNIRLLEPDWGETREGYEVWVEGGTIREVSDRPILSRTAIAIDGGGRTLMPGLIDAHVHVFLTDTNIRALEAVPLTLMTARTLALMHAMLMRGFTTVRDTGGADWGIRDAVAAGLAAAPRLFIAGRAIGPTGGHTDARRRTMSSLGARCHCCNAMTFQMGCADGVSEVRTAVREQLRQGADHIKIMMSGGVASPYDPLDSLQFSESEIAAAVEEASAFGRYVCAHAYTPEAIARAARLGVRTIEHGNLIDEASAKLMAEKGMILVANLVAYETMREHAEEFGLSAEMRAKNEMVIEGAYRSLEICRRHGIPVGFGSDLLGDLQAGQAREFLLRREVMAPIEIIRSATSVGATILRMEGKLGTIAPGAYADLLLVDGDPLADLGLFQDQGRHLAAIMKDGRFVKNRLG